MQVCRSVRPQAHQVGVYCKCTGCVNAPLPAESQAAKRIHFLPAASKGMRYRWVENGASEVADRISRLVAFPSPQTSSTNSAGQVQSTSTTKVRLAPVP